MEYNFADTIGGKLLAEYRKELMDCLVWSNDVLPEEYQNHRDGGRSLTELEAIHIEETKPSQHQLDKAAKAERIEKYRQQWADNGTIEYDVDDNRLYRFQTAFVKSAMSAGWIKDS